jgi:hypothetical protein
MAVGRRTVKGNTMRLIVVSRFDNYAIELSRPSLRKFLAVLFGNILGAI